MSYENLEHSLKALALTVPASRAFGMTVKFALTQGRDTATVFKLEDHFRDRKAMKNCIERMRQDPLARKCIEDRYLGPELDLDALVQYPRGSLGYTYAKVLKKLGYATHFYTDRKRVDAETDYVTMRVRKTHDIHHIITGFSMQGGGELGVIAITALQYGYPAFMTLDLGAMALSMLRVEGWGEHVHYMRAGREMAERIKPLLGVRWEEGLD